MTMPLDAQARASAEDLLPPPPGLLARLMCMATPSLKPLYKEQQVREWCPMFEFLLARLVYMAHLTSDVLNTMH
jgi:hypothetical protein